MTTGVRAQKILKACGIDAKICKMGQSWCLYDAAAWTINDVEYRSTCTLRGDKWRFQNYNTQTYKWTDYEFDYRHQLIAHLINEFNITGAKLCGIYGYFDESAVCVYIGKDTHIYSLTRHYQHINNPNNSPIDIALKENDYKYKELFRFTSVDQMNKIEKELIKILKPKYNVHFKEINNE